MYFQPQFSFKKNMSAKPKAPFKGRPAAELIKYAEQCLEQQGSVEDQLERINELVVYLLDMDTDCNPKQEIAKPAENPTGLAPEAMVDKMDILLQLIFGRLGQGVSDELFVGLLEVFENSVLKLYQPHYIQFVTYFIASVSKQKTDGFLSLLLNIVHDESSDPIARREAISYIGSFVCRATFLGWTHSARTAKYLVSFMHSLNISSSSSDRLLFALTLQTVCYMTCWECSRWKDHVNSHEFDWIFRSKKGLIPILHKTRHDGVLRLVSLDILTMLVPLVGRISMQFKEYVSEAIATYRQLLSPQWKPLLESKLLKPHFPFDPFHNLPRTCPIILPLCREWEDHGSAVDASDGHIVKSAVTTDESSGEEIELHEEDDNVWSFHPITAALTGGRTDYHPSPIVTAMGDDAYMLVASPIMDRSESPRQGTMESMDLGENLVLTRILSSKIFAPAP